MVLYLHLYTSALGSLLVLHATVSKMKTIVTYFKLIFRNEHFPVENLQIPNLPVWRRRFSIFKVKVGHKNSRNSDCDNLKIYSDILNCGAVNIWT